MSSKNSGMTLLEVMVAITILAGMMFIAFQATSSNFAGRERSEKRNQILQQARVAVSRLTRDLANAFLVAPTPAMVGSQSGSPVIETRFKGEGGSGQDKLSFTAFSHFRYIAGSKESDQAVVSYFVEQDPDERDKLLLMRRESKTIDVGEEEKGMPLMVAEGIKSFELEYLDNKTNEWRRDWDSKDPARQNRLPRAVRITLAFADPQDSDFVMKFSTIGLVTLQSPIEF